MSKEYKKVKLKNGEIRYIFDVSLGVVNGQRKRTTVRAKSVKEGRQKVAQLQLKESQVIDRTDTMTVSDAYELYLLDQKHDIAETTYNSKVYFKTALKPLLGLRLRSVTDRDISRWIISLDCAQSTKRGRFARLKAFFKWCVKKKLIDADPTIYVDTPKVRPKEMSYITEAEFWKIWRHTDNERYKMALILAFYTGLRKSEFCGLSLSDLKDGELHLTHTVKPMRGTLTVSSEFKNHSSKRIVPLPKWLIFDYTEFFKREPYPLKGIYRHINEAWNVMQLEEPDINYVRVHDLRHSYCAMLLSRGIDIYTVSKLLGHTNINITVKVYSHLYDSTRKKVADVL